MARSSTATSAGRLTAPAGRWRLAEATHLSCGCHRQEVVDAGRHRKTCKKTKYPQGCDSLDCNGDCLVTDQHCDGEDDDE